MASESTQTHGERMRAAALLRAQGVKLCNGSCGRVLPLDAFHWRTSSTSQYKRPNSRCKDCMKEYNRERYATMRAQVLAKYGGCCAACGDDRTLALDLDHVNDDGCVERLTATQDHRWLKYLLEEPLREDLQVLCGSCHNIKTRGGNPAEMGR